jgi:phage anti-repressor protein
MNVRKDHLKTLLISNFIKDTDYIEIKESGKKGNGVNNRIHVLLTYTCSKLLCMISKSEKANLIRNYYIDLEKLMISYKDNIVNDLNKQLNIKKQNNQIIDQYKSLGLLYILKVDDETKKIGTTTHIKSRMKQYNVGRISELPIIYVFKCNDINEVEKCVKQNLSKYRIKKNKNNELFKVDDEFIKQTINYCNINTIKIKENKKLLKKTQNKNWLMIIDKKNTDVELYRPPKIYQKKTNNKPTSKKITNNKPTSKKTISKKTTSKKITNKKIPLLVI